MAFSAWIGICLIGAMSIAEINGGPASPPLTHQTVAEMMRSEASFSQSRYPLHGAGREGMRVFIKNKFANIAGQLGGIDKGHNVNETSYSTRIFERRDERTITGRNILLILKGSKPEGEDEPIVILANYDSDESGNIVDDNGSGVAAMLVLGDYFARQVVEESVKLEHSIIFAATDTAIRKYNSEMDGVPTGAMSGADQFVKEYLPNFLKDRKGFKGAIVLDGLLNYNNNSRTQETLGMDKGYPEAYGKISDNKFAGNFLALIARPESPDSIDSGLADRIENGWKNALRQPKMNDVGQIDPPIISFKKKLGDPDTDAVFYFARSEHSSFWNHHAPRGPQYPAVLLTDTRERREAVCRPPNCNFLESSLKPDNLAFIHRTIMTLHSVLRGQTDKAGAPSIQSSSILMMIPLLALSLRYLLAFNI